MVMGKRVTGSADQANSDDTEQMAVCLCHYVLQLTQLIVVLLLSNITIL